MATFFNDSLAHYFYQSPNRILYIDYIIFYLIIIYLFIVLTNLRFFHIIMHIILYIIIRILASTTDFNALKETTSAKIVSGNAFSQG